MVTYDLGSVADWLSAIGTIGAVIVALYLAHKDRKPRVKVTSKFNYLVYEDGSIDDDPINISCEIVNLGQLPLSLNECTIVLQGKKMVFSEGEHVVRRLLNPGEHYVHALPYGLIKRFCLNNGVYKVNTYVFFSDAISNRYKSKVRLNFKKAP